MDRVNLNGKFGKIKIKKTVLVGPFLLARDKCPCDGTCESTASIPPKEGSGLKPTQFGHDEKEVRRADAHRMSI